MTTVPSPFVVEWVPRVAAQCDPGARALDLAMGSGRHVDILARAGFCPFGVDLSFDKVREAAAMLSPGTSAGRLRAFCADMTQHPLPRNGFQLVLITRYLDRLRIPGIKGAVAPRGFVMYETFTRHQLALGRGPTSPDHLLDPGELRELFSDFDVLFTDESHAPDALARIVARRRD